MADIVVVYTKKAKALLTLEVLQELEKVSMFNTGVCIVYIAL